MSDRQFIRFLHKMLRHCAVSRVNSSALDGATNDGVRGRNSRMWLWEKTYFEGIICTSLRIECGCLADCSVYLRELLSRPDELSMDCMITEWTVASTGFELLGEPITVRNFDPLHK